MEITRIKEKKSLHTFKDSTKLFTARTQMGTQNIWKFGFLFLSLL